MIFRKSGSAFDLVIVKIIEDKIHVICSTSSTCLHVAYKQAERAGCVKVARRVIEKQALLII